MVSGEDPLSLHLGDQCLNNELLIEDHNIKNSVDHNNNSLGLFNITN
jgi:hypothetical protein